MVDYEIVLYFAFKYRVDVPPKIRCVREAPYMERLGCLLKGGGKRRTGLGRSGWSGGKGRYGLSDNSVDLFPDNLVGLVTEDRIQKR